jgi:iron complex transport system substrate-binding protein
MRLDQQEETMQRPSIRSAVIVAAALAALAGLLTGCGDDSDTASTGTPPTEAPGDATTVPSGDVPERIVSLSPTATEMLFAIDAGDLVVAVDEYSTYPEDAPVTDLSGFTPNVEAIAGYEPDLVVMSDDIDGIVAQLEDLGITTLLLPAAATLDDSYAQIEQLGAATGRIAEAAEVVLEIETRIDEATARVPATETPLTYYHELDSALFSVTSATFIGEIYALAGLENIADPADTAGGGYPQLTTEFLIDADPDLVFLADTKCCNETAATFGARPGFDVLTAVENGSVIELDDDIASRWGPRTADLLETIVDALEARVEPAKAN